jgi:hypothetical protein
MVREARLASEYSKVRLMDSDGNPHKPARFLGTAPSWIRLGQWSGILAGLWLAWTTVAGDPVCVYFWFGGPLAVLLACAALAGFRGRRGAAWGGLIASALVLGSALMVIRLGTPKCELVVVGDEIIRSLDTYRRDHGRFPESLGDAGIRPAWNRFGGWQYHARDGGAQWDLSIGGDISSPGGFVYYTSSERRQWGYDSG